MAKNKRISTDALTEEEKNITKSIVSEKAKNIDVSSISKEADKLYKSILGRVNASGYKSVDTLQELTRDIYKYEKSLSRLSLAGVDVSSNKAQASEIFKATGEQTKFFSQFKNEDSYWDNEYRNKYKNYTLADVDKILTDALDKPFFSANDNQRELKWLKDNRAYFMTDSELKDAISEGEEKSKEYSSQKSNATWDYISSSVSSALASQTVTGTLNTSIADNSLTGADKNDSLNNKKNYAKRLKTQNEEELDKYKRIYAQRESVTDEELKELYSQADERNIFDVLKKDYSYTDYANDKDDKRIYGAEIVSRNYYKMNEQINADTHIYSYTGIDGNEKTGSALDLLDKYISMKRMLNSFGASSPANIYVKEQASIRQAFESNGYDFDSVLDAYERKINKESNEDMVGNVKEFTEEHPVLSNAGSVATNILSGISTVPNSLALGLEDLLSDDVVMLDVNSPEWALKNVTDTVRNTTSQMLATEDYGKLKSFLYQTGMSTVDFLATSLATGFNEPATLLLMSSNAGADAMKTVTENGGSASDALTMGIAAALSEALCEKVSVEQLFSSVNTTTGKEWLYNLVKGLVSEGSEEVATDLLNNVTDIILNANQSEFKQNVYEYMRSEGLGANEATTKAFEDIIKNMALSFAGGALSGGIMTGVGGAIGSYKVNNEYKSVGKNINNYEDGADTVLNFARELISENQDDKKLSFDISKAEKKTSDVNIGRLYTSVQSNLENKINETAKNEAVNGIKSRVEELGLDTQLSNKAAEIIYKAYTGKKLTSRQRQILNENKYVKRAYNELVSSDSLTDSESYSNSWVNDVRLNIAQSTQNSVVKSNELKKLNLKNETSSMSESEIERRTARVQGSDKTVVVNKVVSKTDNGFIAQLSDGSEALIQTEDTSSKESSDLDTIAFNTMDMNKAVIYASNYKSTQTANAYIQAVVTSDNIENISSFQKAFNTVYQQGLQNKKMNISGLDITSTQAELAYISGKNDASVTENKINNKGTGASKTTSKRVDGTNIVHIIDTTEYKSGLTRLDSTRKLSNNTDTQLKVLDAYGKKHNLSFITVDTIDNSTVNGMQIGKNKIVIALDAEGGAYLSIAGHEVYHYLEKNNPSDADVIREFVINYLKNVDENYDYDKNFKYFSEKYGTEDVKLIESEITANSMFEVLGNEKTINQLAQENIGIFSKIKTALEKFINELKDIIRGLPWKEKEALQDNIEILSVIKSMFDTAMDNAEQKNYDEIRYSIKKDTDGNKFVEVDDHYFDKNNGESHAKTIAIILKNKFNNLINANGQKIQINAITTSEWTRSESAVFLQKKHSQIYNDKLKAIANADELLSAARNWIGENIRHTRKDNIVEFARGKVMYRVDSNGYVADILVGIRSNGAAVLYDIKNIYIKKITDAPLTRESKTIPCSEGISVIGKNISQPKVNVNTKFSKKMISEAEKSRQELLKANDNLRVANTILKNELRETRGNAISYKQSAQLAKDILNYFGSKYDKSTLTKELYDIFRWYDSNSSSYDYVCDYLSKIGEDVIKESGYLDTTLYDEYAEAREELRKMRFTLPDKVLKQLNENYDGKFRQQTFGKMQLVSKAKNPDVMYLSEMYSELAAEYPNFFSIEDNEYEQPQKLLDFWSAIKPTYSDGINEMGFKDSTDAGIGFAYSVFEKYLDLPNHETFADRKKKEYQRNLNAAKKKLRQERDEKVAAVKKYYRNKIEENRLKRIDTQNKLKLRNNVISKVRRLSTALTSPTDSRHIPEQYKKIVTEYLMLFTDDSVVFDEARLQRVIEAYKALDTNYENDLSNTDPDMLIKLENLLTTVKEITDGNRLSTLNIDEIEEISVITDHLYHLIDNANKIVINGKKKSFNITVSTVIGELNSQKSKFSKKFFDATSWNSTGYYFFKRIGGTLNELYQDLLNGQHEYGLKMAQAQEHLQQLGEKYNVNQWMNSKKSIIEVSNDTGDTIELSTDEAMGIYAVYMREQLSNRNSKHLIKGGMTKDNTVVNGIENVQKIINSLTNEQIQYVEEVIKYLSTTVGDWGNETSLKMFGYKKFNEKWYYPFHIDSDFSKSGFDNVQQENNSAIPLIKNKSFTKSTVQGASNPIRVEKFTDVVSQHITEMICYNTLAQAQANLSAVYKYTDSMSSVRSSIARAYGNQAKKYVSTLIKDISAGATNYDSNEWFTKAMGKFKKNAVAANLSVVVQQPSAIGRAMALVDPKYFLTSSPKNGYEELKKYSGVAVIKEIGGFDISTSKGNAYWLMTPKPKEIKNKFKALANENYREDVLGWAAGKADELTWALIWQGVKNEIADTTNLKGEELLEAAGNRFNEVIEATQVYDSVLTRSQIMRSQGAFSKMATAFMAEPTKKVNMLMDAFYNFVESSDSAQKKNSGKMLMRTIGSILCATVINAVCKSFVSAGRDDDEYQSYVEKYIEALISNTISDLSVMQGFPIIKDVISIFQGYDISRTDMDMVTDLINSVQEVIALFDDNTYITGKDIGEVAMSFAGSVGALVGFPVTNILRDLTAIKRTIMSIFDDKIPTSKGMKYSSLDAFIESFDNIILNPFENLKVNEDDIYNDLVTGDLDKFSNDWDLYESYLIYCGKTSEEAKKTIRSKVKNIVKVNLLKEKITIEEAEKYLCEYLGDDNGYWTAKKWLFENDEDNEGIEYNKYSQLKDAVIKGESIDNIVKELMDHNTKSSTVQSNISETIKEAFNEGQISETEAENKLQKYCDKTKDEANDKVDVWKFESKYPDSELSDSGIKQFAEAEKSGITLDVFEKYYTKRSELSSDKDADGNIIRNSKKEKILNLINSLPITSKQKDVLYFQNNYSEKTLNDAPWH